MRRTARALLLLAATACVLVPLRAAAIERLEAEQAISEFLPQDRSTEEEDLARRPWALLPQIGYAPDTGVLGGLKFTHRDLLDSGATLDLEGTYAFNEQRSASLTLGSPFLVDNRLVLLLRTTYYLDPQRDFFGLGNNDVGPDPVSTHEIVDYGATFTAGWRLYERLSLNFQAGAHQVDIHDGSRDGDLPFTPVAFPDLAGIDGGVVVPFALSLVWNDRDDVMRPSRGWRLILKALHTNKSLGSDFEYSQFIFDTGYVRSFWERKLTVAGRFNAEWIEAPESRIPFWELSVLGGDDTLRGFFPYRFLGKARALINLEARFEIVEFDFYDLWHVDLDGVLFGDTGRVFISDEDIQDEFGLDSDIFGRILGDFQYDFGFGFRIALSQALVARIDAGFSDEEKGLIYLSFGQAF